MKTSEDRYLCGFPTDSRGRMEHAGKLDRGTRLGQLRDYRGREVLDVGTALMDQGFRCIEVPLNSPDPLESIRRLAGALTQP